jgi:lysophospholipase L1-like esterase
MTTINQLSEADTLQNGDQFPIFSEAQGDTRKVNFLTLKEAVAEEFVSLADLAAQTGAGLVGTANGTDVQQALDSKIALADLSGSGTAALIGAAGGVTVQAALDSKRAYPKNTKIAFLGDSITADGISNTADETRMTNRGFSHWVPFLTAQRFSTTQALNFGVSGQTSAQIAARVGDVIAANPGVCMVCAGTNDIGSLTTAQTQANLATIYEALSKAGIIVIALPILPRTLVPEASYSFPQKVNEWIRQQPQNYAGLRFVDPFLFGDPYSVSYSPNTGYTYDGLHPMAIGAFTICDPVATYLNTLIAEPGASIRSVCDYWNSSNLRGALNANPLLGGNGGTKGAGVTGDVADSHRVQAFANGGSIGSLTVTCSKSTATSPLTGMVNQRIVLGGTATGGFDTCVILDVPAGVPNISAGDTIEMFADIEVAGATIGVSGVEAYLAVQMNGTYKYVRDGYAIVSDDYIWKAIGRGTFRTPPLAISGTIGGSLIGIKIYLKNTGTTRSADVRVNNIVVRKVV